MDLDKHAKTSNWKINPILFGKKFLSIFLNWDERKIIILNPKKKKKKPSSHALRACDEAVYVMSLI